MESEVEKVSFKSMSRGLGFYSKQIVLKDFLPPEKPLSGERYFPHEKQEVLSTPVISDALLPQKLDLNSEGDYERLLYSLEQPWLGSSQKTFYSSATKNKPIKKCPSYLSSIKKGHISQVFGSPSLSQLQTDFQENSTSTSKKMISDFKKTSSISLRSYCIDFALASLLFFPPLYFFISLTQQSPPLLMLKSLWVEVLVSCLIFAQIYLLVCRLFCLESYGESLSKRRLCSPKNSHLPIHPWLLFWRFLVSCLTGFVALPILSVLLKKDLFSYLTGLSFQKIDSQQ